MSPLTVTEARVRQLNRWLDELLRAHALTDRELVLVGFSQGSILAAVCGTRRRCRGVVAVGGVPGQPVYNAAVDDYIGGGWMGWERLIDARAQETGWLLVNGTADGYVDRRRNEKMLAPFRDVTWHWDEGLGHDFPESWYAVAIEWIRVKLLRSCT